MSEINQTAQYNFNNIIGKHPLLLETIVVARKLAQTDHPILIQGETGTGKELFTSAIHNESSKKGGPFVFVSCSSLGILQETADDTTVKQYLNTLLEKAKEGTIVLDEIGDLTIDIQKNILYFLESMEVQQQRTIRFISTTTKNVLSMIEEGTFREDLYYRLNVLSLEIPSLREIKSDIPILVDHFIRECGQFVKVDKAVYKKLANAPWYGNVRELKNTIAYMLAVFNGKSIEVQDLPIQKHKKAKMKKIKVQTSKISTNESISLMEKKEYYFILQTIMECNDKGEPSSRRIIADKSNITSHPLSTQQVRHRLDFLEKHGYITIGRGRAGTKITSDGLDYFHSLESFIQV
ncbi:sigma 54-interacting transcriptional regulator [Cytobacillus suaedae]|nr:sigma 54-interacting transcriptional regulator [Cytobacillus suaedae]